MLSWPRRIYIWAYLSRGWLPYVAGCLFVYWLTLPASGQIDAYSCQPNGLLARVSSRIYPKTFWVVQISHVRKEAETAEGWDAKRAKEHAIVQNANAKARLFMEGMFVKHPEMRPSPTSQIAQALRDQADQIEVAQDDVFLSRFFQNRATEARACEAYIGALLNR